MTAISSYSSSGYYSLASGSGQQQAGALSSGTAVSTKSSLAEMLSGNADNNSSYLLDLSPEAQKYLRAGADAGITGLFGSNTASTNNNFILNGKDRQQISDIVAKYKDAPYTQETFNKIQDELRENGLAADQLSSKDKVTSFNATQVFLDALNGTSTDDSATSDEAMQQKTSNYMQQIISQWQNISTTKGKDAGASSPTLPVTSTVV